jgi:DNA-binding response OmpR family regulator
MIKIMVVDDEQGICNFIKDTFERKGYHVLCVTDPFQAIPTLENEKPQVLILDIAMKEMDGLDILKKLKDKRIEVKVIMLTFIEDPEVKAEACALGADDFLTKPFSTENLEEVVMRRVQEAMGFIRKG